MIRPNGGGKTVVWLGMCGPDIPTPGKPKHVLVVQIMKPQIGIIGIIPAHIRVPDKPFATRFELQTDLEHVRHIAEPLGLSSAIYDKNGDGQTIDRTLGAQKINFLHYHMQKEAAAFALWCLRLQEWDRQPVFGVQRLRKCCCINPVLNMARLTMPTDLLWCVLAGPFEHRLWNRRLRVIIRIAQHDIDVGTVAGDECRQT